MSGDMELIRTLRNKRQTSLQQDIMRMAEDYITLSDFDNSMYISYNGIPLVPIEQDWTVPQILEKLSEIRQNYVNAKLKENNLPKIAAML